MRLRNMLQICLVFWESEPQYAYKRYAYKNKHVYSKTCLKQTCSKADTCLKQTQYFVPKYQLTCQSLINITCLKLTPV